VNLSYTVAWSVARAVFATYFRWRVFNSERVPAHGPAILASNHASFLDPPLVGAAADRDIHYMARSTLFRFPPIGLALRSWNAVPLEREGNPLKGMKVILEKIERGGAVLLFPEGTRTAHGRLQPARAGIGLIVIRTTAPVIPVRVFGTYEALGRHVRFPQPVRVAIKFGAPLPFAELRAAARRCSKERLKEIYQQIGDEIMAAIGKLEPHQDVTQFP
jgi:1-acyl-sn-glycerol-3-phosphate acyltransferase